MHNMDHPAVSTMRKSGQKSGSEVLESIVRERTAALHNLSARLLRVQEEERRRLARELHDSTGQILTALKLELASVENRLQIENLAPQSLAQAVSLVDEALREIRTTSHLLYPPLLEEVGFHSAAQWYVEGFARRSNIQVRLKLSVIQRMSRLLEIALFRILQESLTNIYRHSDSRTADVQLEGCKKTITLQIRDHGKGIPAAVLSQFKQQGYGTGVGLAGMRERIQEFGGCLDIFSDSSGTLVRASVPAADLAALPGDVPGIPDPIAA